MHPKRKKEEKKTPWHRQYRSNHRTAKGRILLQVLDQLIDIRQMPAQHLLLGLLLQGAALARPLPLRAAGPRPVVLPGRLAQPARGAPLLLLLLLRQQASGVAAAAGGTVGDGDGGRLGHEVEVEELHGLELDVAGGAARLEDGGDGEEAVEVLEGAGVAGGLEQGDDQDQEGGGLDGGAVDGLEEVEEELWVGWWC